jgi:hypothetical protein
MGSEVRALTLNYSSEELLRQTVQYFAGDNEVPAYHAGIHLVSTHQ